MNATQQNAPDISFFKQPSPIRKHLRNKSPIDFILSEILRSLGNCLLTVQILNNVSKQSCDWHLWSLHSPNPSLLTFFHFRNDKRYLYRLEKRELKVELYFPVSRNKKFHSIKFEKLVDRFLNFEQIKDLAWNEFFIRKDQNFNQLTTYRIE